MKRFISGSSAETRKIAARIALRYVGKGRKSAWVFGLVGDLGAGKTTFSQAFLRACGVRKKITSPTFVLVKSYALRRSPGEVGEPTGTPTASSGKASALKKKSGARIAYHIDAYRLRDAKELRALGFRKIAADPGHIVLVEWADHVRRAMPKSTTWITFGHLKGDKRSIIMKH